MKAKITAHIISHTHWDREWYLNSRYTNEWLVEFFDRLFKMLEKEKEYTFVLDGQTSMIEDYFDELGKRNMGISAYRDKIKKYVEEGRLFIGPYYLQPDWQLVSGEALVRNMLIGCKLAKSLGGVMKTGWLPDNFGQISQTAQLHKGFGIKGLYVWRGVDMEPEAVRSEFLWEAPDGTRLPSVYLLDSYRNAMRLAECRDIMRERIYDEVEKLLPFATTANVLLMNGYDQEMAPDDILPEIAGGRMDSEDLRIIQSNPEKYMEELIRSAPELDILKGALYSGRYIAVFPGVLSSRMYLKLQNDRCQKALEKYAEPLSLISWALGGEYERTLLEQAWKVLLKNHPHDSICGVSIDDVHSDMEERFRTVEKLAESKIEAGLKYLAGIIDTSGGRKGEAYIIFNPCAFERTGVISIAGESRLVSGIPPLGCKVIYPEIGEKVQKPVTAEGNRLDNGIITVEIQEDGSFDLIKRDTGRVYRGLGVFEDQGDAGDEYDYSYPDKDRVITSRGKRAEIEFVEKSAARVQVRIMNVLEVPEALSEDRRQRSGKTRSLPVVTYLALSAGSPYAECRVEVKNTVKDHRLRVLFPTGIKAETSCSGSVFDIVERPVNVKDYNESDMPESLKRLIIGAREAKANTIFPQKEFVDIHDGKDGLAVLSKGLTEYQILPEAGTIAVTLFRSVGRITAKINTRIGDAGPEILTPGAQCLRSMTFEYAVYAHEGDTLGGNVPKAAEVFNSELLAARTSVHNGTLPDSQGFFRLSDAGNAVRITAVKRSEDGEAVIVRCCNVSVDNACAGLWSYFLIKRIFYADLKEEPQEEAVLADRHRAEIMLLPKQIVTLRLEIERESIRSDMDCLCELLDEYGPENLEEYEGMPEITREEAERETARAEGMKAGMDDPVMRRSALEAELSSVLCVKKLAEQEIRRLGYMLNDARVKRRLYDYIAPYIRRGTRDKE